MINIVIAMGLRASVSGLILLGFFEFLSPACPYLFHECLAIVSSNKLSVFLSPFESPMMEMIIYLILSHSLHTPSSLFFYFYCFVPLIGWFQTLYL